MSIRVKTTTSNVSVRVGQENAVKVLSSAAGGLDYASNSGTAINVIGGIASVSQLNVSGISTFTGITSFTSSSSVKVFGSLNFPNGNIISVPYLDLNKNIKFTETAATPKINQSFNILTNSGTDLYWTNALDGGTY
jgi:hypothetical protein